MRRPTWILLLGAAIAAAGGAQDPQKPVLRSGVELLIVDAQVIDRDGQPIATLRPEDFEVELGGKKRRVVSANLVRYGSAAAAVSSAPPPTAANDTPLSASAAGGAVIRIQDGSGDYAFERVLRENSAYYVLGVELEPADRDGQPHGIKVRVRQRGATIRSRTTVIVPKGT